jgi:hypothetical protein
LLRESNDHVLGLNQGYDVDVAEFLCECGEQGCTAAVEIGLSLLAAIRRDPTLLLVAPDHLPGGHEVVDARPGYRVVRIADAPLAATPEPAAPPADGSVDEVQWRLLALRTVLEREGGALARIDDERLLDVLVEIDELKLSIANALGSLATGRPLDS